MDFVKPCRNLSTDKCTGEPFCRSTHVCYRSVCSCDLFSVVYHRNGHILSCSVEDYNPVNPLFSL